MDANAESIPSVGIDKNTLQKQYTKIHTIGGWPINIRTGSIVYILFKDSTYAIPYTYDEEFGYTRFDVDDNKNKTLDNRAQTVNPLTWSKSNKQFSNIRVYVPRKHMSQVYAPRNSSRYESSN